MEFAEYKIGYYKRWQRHLLRICWIMFVLLLAIEVTFGFAFHMYADTPAGLVQYAEKRVFLPSGINLAMLICATVYIRSPRQTIYRKNYAAIFIFLMMLGVVSFFHSYYAIVFILPCAALFLSALFTDRKLLNAVFVTSLVIICVSLVNWFLEYPRRETAQSAGTVIGVLIVYGTSYYSSCNILYAIQNQTDFIYSGYMQQRELISELRIEPLTKLYNRIALSETIAGCIRSYKESDGPLMLALVDIDNFKHVNDTYGHGCGDIVLVAFSGLLTRTFGGNRNIFRYGGDEFVVLFKDQSLESVESAAELLRTSCNALRFDFMRRNESISVSMGIAEYHKGMDSRQWFDAADSAAYAAKEAGKNQFVVV